MNHPPQAASTISSRPGISSKAKRRLPSENATIALLSEFVVKPSSTAIAAKGTSTLPLAATDAAEMAAAC